jgi:hypothetical protein
MNTTDTIETIPTMTPVARPAIVATDVPAPIPAPVEPVNVAGQEKQDHRFGSRKVVNPDGTVDYGMKMGPDGVMIPKKRPGRKPKQIA